MAEKSSWDQAKRPQKLGLVWRNRKKISQIITDYFYLPFFLLIIFLWLRCIPREIRNQKSEYDKFEPKKVNFSINTDIVNCLQPSKNPFWKHLLLKIKFLFSKNGYVCQIWIFIFDTEQAKVYSAGKTSESEYHSWSWKQLVIIFRM